MLLFEVIVLEAMVKIAEYFWPLQLLLFPLAGDDAYTARKGSMNVHMYGLTATFDSLWRRSYQASWAYRRIFRLLMVLGMNRWISCA